MYTHFKFPFKRALHFSTLVIKLSNSNTKLFQAIITGATL